MAEKSCILTPNTMAINVQNYSLILTLPLGGHDIYNFGRPFLGHYYYILRLSDIRSVIKKIFKEINLINPINFTLFYPLGWGLKFTISHILTLKIIYQVTE